MSILFIFSVTHFPHYLLEVQEDLKILVIQIFPEGIEKGSVARKTVERFNL